MAKNIGTLTLATATVAGVARVAASQDGRLVAHAPDVKALIAMLQGMGLTGTLKRGVGPVFTHDCTCCRFLGHSLGADHYSCSRGGSMGVSLVTRTGDDGPDYHSMPAVFMVGITYPVGSPMGDTVALFIKAGAPGL